MASYEFWKQAKVVELYNIAIATLPFEIFSNKYRCNEFRNEFWYRSLFVMFLRGAGIISYSEVHTYIGQSDLVIPFLDMIFVIEFKFADKTSNVQTKLKDGIKQILKKGYAKGYETSRHKIICAVIVADDEKRQAIMQMIDPKQEVNYE